MNEQRKTISRIKRLHRIELRAMEVLAADLNRLDMQLQEQQSTLAEIDRRIENVSSGANTPFVDQLTTRLTWLAALEKEFMVTQAKIAATLEQRSQVQDDMMKQRAKVRGWELHLQRLSADLALSVQNQEAADADDRYLNSPSPR